MPGINGSIQCSKKHPYVLIQNYDGIGILPLVISDLRGSIFLY